MNNAVIPVKRLEEGQEGVVVAGQTYFLFFLSNLKDWEHTDKEYISNNQSTRIQWRKSHISTSSEDTYLIFNSFCSNFQRNRHDITWYAHIYTHTSNVPFCCLIQPYESNKTAGVHYPRVTQVKLNKDDLKKFIICYKNEYCAAWSVLSQNVFLGKIK